ncbi:hypothetical protein PGO16_22645 [Klebsiella aerogenes]
MEVTENTSLDFGFTLADLKKLKPTLLALMGRLREKFKNLLIYLAR